MAIKTAAHHIIFALGIASLPTSVCLCAIGWGTPRSTSQSSCQRWGNQPASSQTLALMSSLGARDIPVYRFSKSETSPARASIDGIWINEEMFAGYAEFQKLYYLAHELGHLARGHCRYSPSLARELEADVAAAHLLCSKGYRWAVEQYIQHLDNVVSCYGPHARADEIHPTFLQQRDCLAQALAGA